MTETEYREVGMRLAEHEYADTDIARRIGALVDDPLTLLRILDIIKTSCGECGADEREEYCVCWNDD